LYDKEFPEITNIIGFRESYLPSKSSSIRSFGMRGIGP
jgi:hypothetical protein